MVHAEVAELADAQDLKSCGTYTPVSVRFRSPAYLKNFVGIAQLDRAFGYGPKGRGFESSNARMKPLELFQRLLFCVSETGEKLY